MVSFNDYRKQWKYFCLSCGEKITAFRDCGKTTTCRCGGSMRLDDVIEPKEITCVYDNTSPAIHTFKPYFDVTMGKVVTSKREINEYCKANNMVYAGDKEITQQCRQNRAENERKFNQAFKDGLTRQLMEKF